MTMDRPTFYFLKMKCKIEVGSRDRDELHLVILGSWYEGYNRLYMGHHQNFTKILSKRCLSFFPFKLPIFQFAVKHVIMQ